MAEPTPSELRLIKEFRVMVEDLELTDEERMDMSLVAWLRARDLDMKKAYEMLKTCLEWRKEHDIANILNWDPPPNYPIEYDYAYTGEESTGCPVCILPFGVWDVRRAFESGEREIWLKYVDKLFGTFVRYIKDASKAREKAEKTGFNVVTQFVIVFDFKGFSMRQLTSLGSIDSILEVARRFEANYPETLKAAYVINAPYVFNLLFSLVKPLLSKRTLGKVEIYGSNEKKWRAVLLKHINQENLPVAYGGTNPFIFKSNKNPSEGKESSDSVEAGEFLCRHINAREKFELEYDITHPNTVLKWNFSTDDYDIGFSILFNDKTEVVGYKRYNSHLETQEGTLLCHELGKYMLTFDNTYSRMKKKTLHYIVTHSLPVDIVDED